jgi:predicted GNAT superfamily acetyltransferase
MGSDNLKYQLILGLPSKGLLDEILEVYKTIFDDYKLDFFKSRISEKDDLLIALCYSKVNLVGFKIGYRYNENTFYSWVGGVLPSMRKKGVARTLAALQEEKVREEGYIKLRTKSMNRFKPMMILNLKNGFDIIQVYTNDGGQTKVVFEKKLAAVQD